MDRRALTVNARSREREGTRDARVTMLTGVDALGPCSPHAAQGHGYRGLRQTGRVLRSREGDGAARRRRQHAAADADADAFIPECG
jgi:hypothetical protein